MRYFVEKLAQLVSGFRVGKEFDGLQDLCTATIRRSGVGRRGGDRSVQFLVFFQTDEYVLVDFDDVRLIQYEILFFVPDVFGVVIIRDVVQQGLAISVLEIGHIHVNGDGRRFFVCIFREVEIFQ